jgi:hypothetical protein
MTEKVENVLTTEEKLDRIRKGDFIIMSEMAKAIEEKYGEEGLEAMAEGIRKRFHAILQKLKEKGDMKVVSGDCTDIPAGVAALGDALDAVAEYPELTPKHSVLHIKSCPVAKQINRTFPQLCRRVLIGTDRAYCGVINPKIKVTPKRYLSEGDEVCELVYDLEE